jgi:hypothetical protein
MKIKHYLWMILWMIIGLSACKSTKNLTHSATVDANLSAKQIIKNHQQAQAKFKTLVGKLKADYKKGDESTGTTINLRIEKDKTIWMSAPFSMAKVLITPDQVSFYNKLDNTYFEGDFKLLSDFVGTDLDFKKVQNILLGESLFELDKGRYNVHEKDNSYALTPKKQRTLFEIFYLVNPSHFKMDAQSLSQSQHNRFLEVNYKSYQEIGKTSLPHQIDIIASDNGSKTLLNLELKSVELNKSVRFPFKIPSGFKRITLQ